MEEKERYEYYPTQNQLYDKINDELYCLGIEQDKTRLVDFLNLMNEDWWVLYIRNKELRQENQQLKQQLHDLPKKIVEEIEKNFTEYLPLKDKTGAGFYCRLNAILKKYGEKEIDNKIKELKGEKE